MNISLSMAKQPRFYWLPSRRKERRKEAPVNIIFGWVDRFEFQLVIRTGSL